MRRLRHETNRTAAPPREDRSVARSRTGGGAVSAARTSVSPQLLHDLRSPLNHMIGYSEMLTEEAEGQRREGFATDIEKIRAAGHRMLALIEETLPSTRESIPVLIAHETAPALQRDVTVLNTADTRGHLLVV